MTRGLLIVVEGGDKLGKTTFVDQFLEQYPTTQRIKLPTPEIYGLIKHTPKEMWHDIFHTNIESVMKRIGEYLDKGVNVICDRYIYSHFVYEELTSKKNCVFKSTLNPNAIVFFVHANPNSLPKDDVIEQIVNQNDVQKSFEKRFKRMYIPVIHVPALTPTTKQIAMQALVSLFGKRLI